MPSSHKRASCLKPEATPTSEAPLLNKVELKRRLRVVAVTFYALLLFITSMIPATSKAVEYIPYGSAKIQILNKITGKAQKFTIPLNKTLNFDDRLSLMVRACYSSTRKYEPESTMFVQVAKASRRGAQSLKLNAELLANANDHISDLSDRNAPEVAPYAPNANIPGDKNEIPVSKLIFSGWIYANHPEISGLSGPVYDVTLVACSGAALTQDQMNPYDDGAGDKNSDSPTQLSDTSPNGVNTNDTSSEE